MNQDQRQLRLGVLGCGNISQIAHFDAIAKARNAQLHAICDQADDLRERMALLHRPARAFSRYEDMLNDRDVEAVVIGTADDFHVALARQAVNAGKHVLVEKPLGVTVEECEELRREIRNQKGRVRLQVGNNRRFDPGVRFAQEFVQNQMGPILAIKAWYWDSAYRYTMTDNLQPLPVTSSQARRPQADPKADKPRYFLMTHGSHLVDTARFLAGGIARVRARRRQRGDAWSWFVELDYDHGALGHLDLSIPVRGDFEEGFHVCGEHGSVKGRVHLPWFHKSSDVECFSAKDRQYHRPLGEDAHTYKLQIEGFADAILQNTALRGADIEDGVAAMRTLVAIARSAETGDWVTLAEAKGGV